MTHYLINMDDGRIEFRDKETDAQINLKPISDELVAMIAKGDVKATDVVNAISAKIKENGDFNLSEYVEALKKLNVRKSNPQKAVEREELKDRSDEEVSLADVAAAQAKASAKEEKRQRIKKVNEALENTETAETKSVVKRSISVNI